MSIREKYGYGPITVEIDWLDDCPCCGHGIANVTGKSISSHSLWSGDSAVCAKCGHKGEIDADGENAWVDWDTVEG